MKVEINLPENNGSIKEDHGVNPEHLPTCDVSIDIGQVLAANQALLKNMARKMENLESKLHTMESAFNEQARILLAERKVTLMLAAPPREVKPWAPEAEVLKPDYFKKFSLFDKVFRPWVMRRRAN